MSIAKVRDRKGQQRTVASCLSKEIFGPDLGVEMVVEPGADIR